jgi:hypothetical protein
MPEEIIDNPDGQGYAESNRDAIYRMLTGAKPDDLREMVRVLGGPKAVAPLVGRSQRTVQRWITTKGQQRIKAPRADARQALQTQFDQVRATRAGRQHIVDGRRATLMRHAGARMRGSARGGPMTAGRERAYLKVRRFDHHVDAAAMGATFDAYIDGGADAAFVTFNDQFAEGYGRSGAYFDDWLFSDLSGLGFTPDVSPDQ